jgi:hypothetical protein
MACEGSREVTRSQMPPIEFCDFPVMCKVKILFN